MSDEVDNKFNLAANYIQSHHQEFNKEQLLRFYAFYKQATVGQLDPLANPKPSFYKLNDRAKWEAWNALKTMAKDEAMAEYVNLLTASKSDWYDESGAADSKSKQAFGVSVSRMKSDDSELINEADKTIEDFIKEGNVSRVASLLESLSIGDINEIDDESGLGILHWSADRGNDSILELILSKEGVNVDLQDAEGQTALHYASSCGHKKCIELLLKHGASKTIVDNDGCSCVDNAFDEEIKKML